MRQSKSLVFGATGLMAASLTLGTLGLGASSAWAAGNAGGNGASNSHGANGNANGKANSHDANPNEGGAKGKGNADADGNGSAKSHDANPNAGGAKGKGNAGGNTNSGGNGGGNTNSHPSSNAGNTPPGNNGTVKIDEFSMDPGQDNDPHVSCGLSVSFFGYDGGPQTATISITPVAPTRGGTTFNTSTFWNVGTRTSGAQLDKNFPISDTDLAPHLAGVTPQAKQGYHLRLEVEVTGSQGSDDKYKVFWYEPCAGTPTPPPPGAGTPTPPPPGGGTPGGGTQTGVPPVGGTTGSVASGSSSASNTVTATKTATVAAGASKLVTPAGSAAASVVPVGALAAPDQSAPVATGKAPSSGGLAFTGANSVALIALALGLIASGLALTRRGRRAPSSM